MRVLFSRILLLSLAIATSTFAQGQSSNSLPHRHASRTQTSSKESDHLQAKVTSAKFHLWETVEELRDRIGEPREYYVPAIERLISPAEFERYRDVYKKIYDVFYRDTTVGLVRVLVAYGKDDSRSHLEPDIRVTHVFFIFDKNVMLRDSLAAIEEVRDLCTGGCLLNGFAASAIAQPQSPSEAQMLLAHKMQQQWEDEMPDATPGVQVFYRDSPYAIDFERSPVERIDLTLVSNANQEKYSMVVRKQEPTMLDVWHPKGVAATGP
jgi:hypothetical protein